MNKNITKIFHSIRSDLSVLYNSYGLKVTNIFDTQLAHNVLYKIQGNQISYKNLVKKYIYKDILKSETNSDWQKRPLTKKQIDYAAEDVRYLHTIMRIQKKRLLSLGKLELFNSICNLEKNQGEENFLKSRLKRFKKRNKNLSKEEIEIFNWRENEAEKLNVPPSYIIEDKNIKRLKKVITDKKYDDLRWIIKNDSSRDNFTEMFS
jgi:ribonuclease D